MLDIFILVKAGHKEDSLLLTCRETVYRPSQLFPICLISFPVPTKTYVLFLVIFPAHGMELGT